MIDTILFFCAATESFGVSRHVRQVCHARSTGCRTDCRSDARGHARGSFVGEIPCLGLHVVARVFLGLPGLSFLDEPRRAAGPNLAGTYLGALRHQRVGRNDGALAHLGMVEHRGAHAHKRATAHHAAVHVGQMGHRHVVLKYRGRAARLVDTVCLSLPISLSWSLLSWVGQAMGKGRPSLIMITPASDDILWRDTKKTSSHA